MRSGFPHARAGQVVGLLGGSFDPAHAGHAMITREALKRFRLDQLWWLVSPGNPLKQDGPAPMAQRLARAREVMHHPNVKVTDIEARIGTRYTARTLGTLGRLYPGVRFVWLMGADNLGQLDRWQEWRWIMDNVPVGVLARPRQRISARMSKAARVYDFARLPARDAARLGRSAAPCWCFVNVPMVSLSSTELRRSGAWTA
ncbi:nicotinate-nucleotide adenylyltransferase [Pseudooceanicola sp.]|uniref:nicotinate-nucleotide adenylyltransferase n=1 Tax=Pseudooceanicola sp. TaxID=1914328 RepID=UPI00405986D7